MSSPVELRSDTEQTEPSAFDSLLRSAAEGDRVAFARLYDLLGPRVYPLARHGASDHAAEEIVFEVFLELWRAVPRFPRQALSARTWTGSMITAAIRRGRRDRGLMG